MKIKSAVVAGVNKLARLNLDLSNGAIKRVKWFDYYYSHRCNARLTCRYFGISPQTFYRWKRRYDPEHLEGLEDRSRRPERIRQPTYSKALVETIVKLRESYPRWGKDKLAVLLTELGYHVSASTVGRVLRRVKEHRLLREPIPNHVSARKRSRNRPYATRKPKDYLISHVGDMVQVDTLDVRPLPGLLFKHFTAHDVVSKWNVLSVHRQASSATASNFLDVLRDRMPFPIKAIQVDGGAEFEAIFERECQKRGIKLFVLPPRSPKLNGGVERAHRTHTEEFYEITDCTFDLADLRQELLDWEITYNTIRPHQSLGYLTPQQFLEQKQKEVRCH